MNIIEKLLQEHLTIKYIRSYVIIKCLKHHDVISILPSRWEHEGFLKPLRRLHNGIQKA